MSLGLPMLLALALFKLSSSLSANSFIDVLGAGFVLWLLAAILVLLTAVPRVALARHLGFWPVEQDWVWRKRQRSALWEGIKVAAAGMAAFGLVVWANHSFVTSTPVSTDVRIFPSAGITSLEMKIPHPNPDECPTEGTLLLSQGGAGSVDISVDGRSIKPLRRSRHLSRYRLPLGSERSTYSCYFDFPEVVTGSRPVPVRLSIAALGSAVDSTPAPTRYRNGFWEWRCKTALRGSGCPVLAVLNADPASAAPSLALLVAGAGFAAVISLLVSVFLALARGWVDDVKNIGRMLKKVGNLFWRDFRSDPETSD